jgi:hypothetical protein
LIVENTARAATGVRPTANGAGPAVDLGLAGEIVESRRSMQSISCPFSSCPCNPLRFLSFGALCYISATTKIFFLILTSLILIGSSLTSANAGQDSESDPQFQDVTLYNDPLCLKWSNRCATCRRDEKSLEMIDCQQPVSDCNPDNVICEEVNLRLVASFCALIDAGGSSLCLVDAQGIHRDKPSLVCHATPPLPKRPKRFQLVTCERFKRIDK